MITTRIAVLALLCALPARAETKLLRFPDIHGDRVAFCYAGDLWTAPVSGGLATRLTAHPGQELFPRFSPDGSSIAFTGQYDGDEQAYVMAATGGMPKQLTFYPAKGPLPARWGYDNQVYGWSRDGRKVLIRSLRDASGLTDSRLYWVGVDAGIPEPLPMPVSGAGALSPDETRVVYSPLVRDFRTWKRYQGGWAQDLSIFDLKTFDCKRITDSPRADRDPMWLGDAIYFTSDRTGTNNLFRYDVNSGATTQITQETVWDVRWPSADDQGRIVFELDGELHVLDTRSGERRKVAIEVPNDGVAMRPSHMNVQGNIESFSLSPKSQRVLFAARGDLFNAPVENGATKNLTHSSSAHDREPRWSADGAHIAFISDRSGEDDLYLINHDGTGDVAQLTQLGAGYRSGLDWSPDGNWLAFRDQRGKLSLCEVASRTVTEIADDPLPFGLDYAWSPDSRFVAYSLGDANDFRSLYIYSIDAKQSHRVTDETWNEYSPTWDPNGNYLFFLSERDFAPQLDQIDWNFVTNRGTGVFALALRRDVKHPTPPRIDEVTLASANLQGPAPAEPDKNAKPAESKLDAKLEPSPITIDFDGLGDRVARLPIAADNHQGLVAVKGHLLYIVNGASYYGRDSERKPALKVFSLEDRKESVLAEGVQGYALAADLAKVLVRTEAGFQLMDAKAGGDAQKKTVATGGLEVDRVPAEEWSQIFDEVWRRYRDFFYADNMHGYDWAALRQRYRTLLPYVAHRCDLNYLIGEMIAELNVGHAYIAGGDWEIPPRPHAALAGARFALDAQAGRYRIAHLFPGHNQEERYRSPLTEVGLNVHAGDYVLAIDGTPLTAADNPERVLRNRGSTPVELTLNDKPSLDGARTIVYQPIGSEDNLVYLEWANHCRDLVARASQGRIAYLHIPDMGGEGIQEWVKWFYGQIHKEALIVDVRSNGGGNVSPMLIERLSRQLAMIDWERNRDLWETTPQRVFYGPMVALIDEDTASDGDQFAFHFRAAKLGPLIGKRTWGGVVGIYGRAPLIDGGSVSVPEAGTCDANGEWAIEGHGVDPDIVVENDPKALIEGRDPQLERAIAEVQKAMTEHPRVRPPRPAPPVKTR